MDSLVLSSLRSNLLQSLNVPFWTLQSLIVLVGTFALEGPQDVAVCSGVVRIAAVPAQVIADLYSPPLEDSRVMSVDA